MGNLFQRMSYLDCYRNPSISAPSGRFLKQPHMNLAARMYTRSDKIETRDEYREPDVGCKNDKMNSISIFYLYFFSMFLVVGVGGEWYERQ